MMASKPGPRTQPLQVGLAVLLATVAWSGRAVAQDAPTPAPAKPAAPVPADYTYLVGGDVWTITNGIIKNGTVVIRAGKIEKVGGSDLKPPAGATVIDTSGKVVSPGFVATGATMGGGGVAPGAQLRDSLDPYSLSVSLAAASGVTSVYLSASGAGGRGRPGGGGGGGGRFGAAAADGSFSTNNIVIKMTEGDLSGMLAAESTVTTLSLESPRGGGGFGRGGGGGGAANGNLSVRWTIQDQLKRAREYLTLLNRYDADKKAGKQATAPTKPADADAVLPLIRQERILRVSATTVPDILYALNLAKEYGIRMVISPATEAWVIADAVAASKAMLVITARDRTLPDERRNAGSGANPNGPGILQKAGVHFAVLPPDTSFSIGGELGRDMLTFALEGAYAMRGGADASAALESLTITAAKAIGMEKRLGSIEPGKDADILVLSGDPLDYRTFVEKTLINGKLYYTRENSTFFRDIKPANAH